jgi:Uma2 family endonuclease
MTIIEMQTTHSWRLRTKNTPPAPPPPLEPGDRLTRAEFERRYAAMPHLNKAELIEGVVHMPSPVRYDHGKPHAMIITWLGVYAAATPAVEFADNATVRLDAENELQPDALLRIRAEDGGQSRIDRDGYVEGAPELVVEIALSSVSYDLHDKLPVYRRAGVREYLVWQSREQQFDWFYLEEGRYVLLPADEQGRIRSKVFPGLHLHVAALLSDDLAAVLQTAQEGVQTNPD